jgi:hypothetical protein
MIKHVQSHENNISPQDLSVIKAQEAILGSSAPRMLDPKAQPFLEDWKAGQKWNYNPQNSPKNNSENIQKNTLEPASTIDFTASCDIIENNEFVSNGVPSFYLDNEYVEMCKKYHVPYKTVYHSYRELDDTEELVAEYADLLRDAKSLGIYWDTSTFDLEGLQAAVEEAHSEEAEHDYFAGLRSDKWAYYSNLGV